MWVCVCVWERERERERERDLLNKKVGWLGFTDLECLQQSPFNSTFADPFVAQTGMWSTHSQSHKLQRRKYQNSSEVDHSEESVCIMELQTRKRDACVMFKPKTWFFGERDKQEHLKWWLFVLAVHNKSWQNWPLCYSILSFF
jgi:hypothetical protein